MRLRRYLHGAARELNLRSGGDPNYPRQYYTIGNHLGDLQYHQRALASYQTAAETLTAESTPAEWATGGIIWSDGAGNR